MANYKESEKDKVNHETNLYGSVQDGILHTGSGDINLGTVIKITLKDGETIEIGADERIALLTQYRTHLQRLYFHLPLAGIPMPRDADLPLERVYVKLRLLPQSRLNQFEEIFSSDAQTLDEILAFVKNFGTWQWQRRQRWGQRNKSEQKVKPVSVEKVIAEHDKVYISGLPGAGKSTILRYLTLQYANDHNAFLPLLIPLSRLDILLAQTGKSFLGACLDLLAEHCVDHQTKLRLQAALVATISKKGVCLLCDGLDEVRTSKQKVIDSLNELAAEGYRLVVTSRPTSYERLAGMKNFEVSPLQYDDKFDFIGNWFLVLAEARNVSPRDRNNWVIRRTQCIKRQLKSHSGLDELADNPLMLTFLVILAGDDPWRELPRTRKKLYQEYIERLFIAWEAFREREGRLVLGDLKGEKAKQFVLWGLYKTAHLLHTAYYDSKLEHLHGEFRVDKDGNAAYYNSKLEHLPIRPHIEAEISDAAIHEWSFNRLDAQALAVETINFWQEAGLLNIDKAHDHEWPTFSHLTLQEYGAAKFLASDLRHTLSKLIDWIKLHLPQKTWAEVIPLTISLLEDSNEADQIVDWLLNIKLAAASLGLEEFPNVQVNIGDNTIEFFERIEALRNLMNHQILFAGRALIDGAFVSDRIRDRIVELLLYRIRFGNRSETTGGASEVFVALWLLIRLNKGTHILPDLFSLMNDIKNPLILRVAAIDGLAILGKGDELMALLHKKDEADLVKITAINALEYCHLDHLSELIYLVYSNGEKTFIRAEAISLLGRLHKFEELLSLVKDNILDDFFRVLAIKSLAGCLEGSDKVSFMLKEIIANPAVPEILRDIAIKAME